jgi:hypothetical protein
MGQSDETVEVLRAIWAVEAQGAEDLDEAVGSQKVCRNMKDVTFDGFAARGSDLRAAWREKLAREGKLSTTGSSVRDLVLGPAESD